MKAPSIAALALVVLAGAASALPLDEAAAKKTVIGSNQAWITASETLDPAPLETWFRGQALEDFTGDCAKFKEKGLSVRFDPPQIAFESVTVDSGKGEAIVVTTEVWLGTAYDQRSGECLSRNGPNKTRATYTLRPDDGRWKVVSLTNESLGERTGLRSCDAPAPARAPK